MENSEEKNKPGVGGPDPVLLFATMTLLGIGVAMVYSASSELALRHYGNEYYFFSRQLLNAALGFSGMLALAFIPYKVFKHLSYVLLFAAVALLSAVLVSNAGHSAGGATRWLKLAGVSFQPAEFARLALIVFMAYSLTKKQGRVADPSIGFLPHFLILFLFTVLILLQPDFGTVALFWMLAWTIMFAGRVPLLHLASALILVLPAALWLLVSADYRLKRYMTFLDPWKYPLDEGYQIIHSLMSFGSGGIFGKGFGEGYQKLFYLPTPHTDFIFSVIGEEGGLIWVLLVVGLYMVILVRGMRIAATASDCFGSLLAFGITVSVALQAIVNMGVTLSLLPTKGLTLPFLSYGGSSLVFNLGCMGILMNIGTARRK
ncbi:MAG: putative lipid II flippase FtsW [Desulfobacteraceae bacterium]|nr:putative lipid II flippase FtsW [Desulfobacteraceae bacterium]MCF8094124.1 putative lipid II flippase FtsW [Desulfobacteraceae bacterium]